MFFSSLGIKQQNNCTNALFVSYLKISDCKRKKITDRFYKISYFSSILNVSETLMANIQLFLVLTLYSSGEQEPDGEDADI